MRLRERNQREMGQKVKIVLDEFAAKVNTIPVFQDVHLQFASVLQDIDITDEQYTNLLKGRTEKAHTAEEEMVNLAVKIGKVLNIFAQVKNLPEVKAISDVTHSDFYYVRNAVCLQKAETIFKHVEANLTTLADFGITSADLNEFEQAIKNFRDAIDTRGESFNEKHAMREKLDKLFVKMNDILKNQLDNFIELFKNSDPVFYDEYWSARVIWDIGGKHVKPDDDTTN